MCKFASNESVYLHFINQLLKKYTVEMKNYFSEFLGTFFLVLCGTGAVVANQESGGAVTHLGIALTFGAIVSVLIYTLSDVSGCHINPAMTLGFSFLNLFPKKEILPYAISQIAGAIAASETLHLLFPNNNKGLGGTLPSGSDVQSFILEIILTFLLFFVVIFTSQGRKETQNLAGFVIGLTVFLEAAFAGPICGASMNPARSIGPALISGNIGSLWIYIFAPVIGSILAALTYKYLALSKEL